MAEEDRAFEQGFDRVAYQAYLDSLPKGPKPEPGTIRIFEGGTVSKVVPAEALRRGKDPLDKAYS